MTNLLLISNNNTYLYNYFTNYSFRTKIAKRRLAATEIDMRIRRYIESTGQTGRF